MLNSKTDSSFRKDERYRTWLSEQKTLIFQKLFNEIAEKVGGVYLAKKAIGLSGHTHGDLYAKKITYETAQKILISHKKLIDKK